METGREKWGRRRYLSGSGVEVGVVGDGRSRDGEGRREMEAGVLSYLKGLACSPAT